MEIGMSKGRRGNGGEKESREEERKEVSVCEGERYERKKGSREKKNEKENRKINREG